MMKKIFAFALLPLIITAVSAQVYNPVSWDFSSKKISDSSYELKFSASIDEGWHMYGLNIPEGGPVATSFIFNDQENINFLTKVRPGKAPKVKFDPTFEMDVELFSDKISFTREVQLAPQQNLNITGSIEFMACDDNRCLPPKEVDFSFNLENTLVKQETNTSTKETAQEIEDAPPAFETNRIDMPAEAETKIKPNMANSDKTEILPMEEAVSGEEDDSLVRLFFLALLAGFGALLTPCVYPIIPLTVSFFMRDTSRAKAIYNGLFFGFSIILIYTLVGLIVGLTKVDLVRLIGSHWIPNLIFLLIFLALAFSFFGLYEITLPGSLSNKIDQQADKGGFLGPFFMAMATVVISFSCTGPIVGVVLGSALQGDLVRPVIGMLGFSISFALPFTLLAVFPNFMKSLPKSGGWLNAVKVFFAFVMLIFSLIFVGNLGISRDLVLSIAIVLLILLGFYLLGKLRFSHDSPVDFISVPRIMLSILAFSAAVYLIPGLFGAPLKSIAPFLPAQESSTYSLFSGSQEGNTTAVALDNSATMCDDNPKYSDFLDLPHGLEGYFDYDEALKCARQLNKPVLLDFAGHSCKNCKKMYAEVWSDTRVLKKLSQDFVIAALYTDDRTQLSEADWVTSNIDGKVKKTIGKKFNDLQIDKFGSNALPLYAIVDAEGNILTKKKYHTYSPDIESFLDFLEEGLE